jgi:hypothetical protein
MIKKDKIRRMVDFIQGKEWDMDRWGGHKLAHVSDEELRRLYEDHGYGVRRLATKYGVKYNSMYQRLKKIGVQMHPSGKNSLISLESEQVGL